MSWYGASIVLFVEMFSSRANLVTKVINNFVEILVQFIQAMPNVLDSKTLFLAIITMSREKHATNLRLFV